jgi:hypothetical protein
MNTSSQAEAIYLKLGVPRLKAHYMARYLECPADEQEARQNAQATDYYESVVAAAEAYGCRVSGGPWMDEADIVVKCWEYLENSGLVLMPIGNWYDNPPIFVYDRTSV